MGFMLLIIPGGYGEAAPGAMPDAAAVAEMMKYNEELGKAGVLLALDGLHPPSMGPESPSPAERLRLPMVRSLKRKRLLAAIG